MRNRNRKLTVLVLVPAVLLASLSSLFANRASGKLDQAATLEAGNPSSAAPTRFKPVRPTRLLLPDAMERAEDIRALLRKDESVELDTLQVKLGVQRP